MTICFNLTLTLRVLCNKISWANTLAAKVYHQQQSLLEEIQTNFEDDLSGKQKKLKEKRWHREINDTLHEVTSPKAQ